MTVYSNPTLRFALVALAFIETVIEAESSYYRTVKIKIKLVSRFS